MEAEYNDRFCSIIKVLPDEVIEEYKAYPNYSEDKIDFVYPDLTPPVFIAQYDEKRTVIALQLYKAGRKYILPEQVGVNVRWGKPDQTYVYKSVEGCNSARDTVYILVDYQMSVVYGTIKPTIEVVTPEKLAVAAESHFKVVIVKDPIQEGMVESAAVHFGIATIDDNHITNHTVYSSEKTEERINESAGDIEDIKEHVQRLDITVNNLGDRLSIVENNKVDKDISNYIALQDTDNRSEQMIYIYDSHTGESKQVSVKQLLSYLIQEKPNLEHLTSVQDGEYIYLDITQEV